MKRRKFISLLGGAAAAWPRAASGAATIGGERDAIASDERKLVTTGLAAQHSPAGLGFAGRCGRDRSVTKRIVSGSAAGCCAEGQAFRPPSPWRRDRR
jgi:hypothetical protein